MPKYGLNKLKSMARAKQGRGSHHRNRTHDRAHGAERRLTREQLNLAMRVPDADLDFADKEMKGKTKRLTHYRGGRTGLNRWAERLTKDVRPEDRYSKVKAMLRRAGMDLNEISWYLWKIKPDTYPKVNYSAHHRRPPEINYKAILTDIIKEAGHAAFNLWLSKCGVRECRCGIYFDITKDRWIYPESYKGPKKRGGRARRLMGLHDVDQFILDMRTSYSHHGPREVFDPKHNENLAAATEKFCLAWVEHNGDLNKIQENLKPHNLLSWPGSRLFY